MAEPASLVAARREAELARERLLQSTHELQVRVAPQRLANDALETAKERGTFAVEAVRQAAEKRPGVAAAAVVGFLAFVARRRIFRLFRRKPKPPTIPATPRRALPSPSGDKE